MLMPFFKSHQSRINWCYIYLDYMLVILYTLRVQGSLVPSCYPEYGKTVIENLCFVWYIWLRILDSYATWNEMFYHIGLSATWLGNVGLHSIHTYHHLVCSPFTRPKRNRNTFLFHYVLQRHLSQSTSNKYYIQRVMSY